MGVSVRLSIVVMAVPWKPERAEHARRLADELDAAIVWDRKHNEWDTGNRALAAFDRDATHHIVIQDDAIVVPNFRRHATAALEALPHADRALVSFYLGTGVPVEAQPSIAQAVPLLEEHRLSWIGGAPTTGVALALPTADIPRLRRFAGSPRVTNPYDERIWRWYSMRKRPVMATWPSLADHVDGDTVAHEYNGERAPRKAWRFGEPDRPWSKQAVFLRARSEKDRLVINRGDIYEPVPVVVPEPR
jgi:hypothetical protein